MQMVLPRFLEWQQVLLQAVPLERLPSQQCFVWPIHFDRWLFVLDCPQPVQQVDVWLQSQQDHWRHLCGLSILFVDSYIGRVWLWGCQNRVCKWQGLLC
jgi:hypothetical protein